MSERGTPVWEFFSASIIFFQMWDEKEGDLQNRIIDCNNSLGFICHHVHEHETFYNKKISEREKNFLSHCQTRGA